MKGGSEFIFLWLSLCCIGGKLNFLPLSLHAEVTSFNYLKMLEAQSLWTCQCSIGVVVKK